MDNGPSFGQEFSEMLACYGIHHIKISPYNSQANGVVERGHYNIREALVKLCGDNLSQWPLMVPAAVYADHITTRRATGFSPYYLLHGVHPLMPGDLVDATLLANYQRGMSTEDLIRVRTQQLLWLPEDMEKACRTLKNARLMSKKNYERKFAKRLRTTSHEPGDLVLIRNNPIENSVSIQQKTANQYMGPYSIIHQTKGRSYVLAEMDGSLLQHHVTAYRLIPYVQWKDLKAWTKQAKSCSNPEEQLSQEMSNGSN